MSFVLFGTVSQCCDATSILDGIYISVCCSYAKSIWLTMWKTKILRILRQFFPDMAKCEVFLKILRVAIFLCTPTPACNRKRLILCFLIQGAVLTWHLAQILFCFLPYFHFPPSRYMKVIQKKLFLKIHFSIYLRDVTNQG